MPPALLCRLRSFAALSLLTLLAFASPCAAQQYPGGGSGGSGYPGGGGAYTGPVYTGGTVTTNDGYFDYSLFNDGTWGGLYYASGGNSATPHTTTCAGGITATYKWNNGGSTDNVVPKCVIIAEYCKAYWTGSASSGGTLTGGCTNPLGGALVPDTPGPGESWEYTSYRVQNSPPELLQISSSPEAHVKATNSSSPTSASNGTASVHYGATVSPVYLLLNDQKTAFQALTGQQITGKLDLHQAPALKISAYTWTVSGSAIKNWDPYGVAADKKTPQQLFPLTSDDLTKTDTSPDHSGISVPPLNFYDQKAELVTVTCKIDFTFPNGRTSTLTVTSKPVTFLKPKVTNWGIETGYARLSAQPGIFALMPAPNTGFSGGEYWHDVTISVPLPFSGGSGCFAQLITPNFEMFQDGSSIPAADPNNKAKGLDNNFPYVGYQWVVPALGTQSDTPATGVGSVNVPQYQGWNTANRSDQFTTWVMYKPPAFGAQEAIWVPLQNYSWDWSCNLKWLNGQWGISSSSPTATTRAPARTPVEASSPPAWSLVQTNSK